MTKASITTTIPSIQNRKARRKMQLFNRPLGGLAPRDIHCHLLPGVDDGFRTADDSLKALRILAAQGCREVMLTPHINPDVYPGKREADYRLAYEAFFRTLPADLPVRTGLAAEYMVVHDFDKRPAAGEDLLAFPDRSILIEMSYYYRSQNLEQAVFELNMAGYRPILAHPERYGYMAGSLEDFDRIRSMGCRMQLNFMSLSGIYGPSSETIMEYLFLHGMYDFVATDLHSLHQLQSICSMKLPLRLRKAVESLY